MLDAAHRGALARPALQVWPVAANVQAFFTVDERGSVGKLFVADESRDAQAMRTCGPVTKVSVRALVQLHRSEQGPVRAFDHRAEVLQARQRL